MKKSFVKVPGFWWKDAVLGLSEICAEDTQATTSTVISGPVASSNWPDPPMPPQGHELLLR